MRVRIQLAGTVSIEHDGTRASERALPGRQARLAFTYLVLERSRTVSHRELAEVLWPDGPPATWQSALRSIASKIRAFLDRAGIAGAEALTGEAGRYDLKLADAIVDVETALENAGRAEEALADGRVEEARARSSEARAVLVQPFLPGVDSDWAERRREQLATARVRCLEVLGECRLRAGEVTDSLTVLEEAVRVDPLRESAWRGMMRAHAEAGNHAKALETYERLRRVLADELGTDPSPTTSELHVQILQRTGERRAETGAVAVPRPASSPIPYRGLATFNEKDAPLFFGREEETRDLTDRLRRRHFVVVVGPSGSGKSSLVRAGVIPALARGALPDSDTWLRATLRPGEDPLGSLASALGRLSAGTIDAAALRSDPDALHAAARRALEGHPAGHRLVLVVDQFEEVFTQTRSDADRDAFITALLRATDRADALTVVLITLRADFYAAAARHLDLAEGLNRSQYVVGPLDPDGLERAIEGPAHHVGDRFEQGLVARIITEVTGQPGALPLLQHALLELWMRRDDSGVLTRAAYEEIGGVEGALVKRAEHIFGTFDASQQATARRVLLRLIQPGEENIETRRRVASAEISGVGDADEVGSIVDALVDARLLTVSSDDEGHRWVEVAHEALIRDWPRLAGWIDEDRQGLRLHRRLTDAARDWEAAQRDDDLLWRGSLLAEAEDWKTRRASDLNVLEAAFLEAALLARRRAERRRAFARSTLLAASLTVAVVFGVLALAALNARDEAERQGDVARSRELAARSTNALETDPETALLLALESYDVAATPEASAAVRSAHAANRLDWRTRLGADEWAVIASRDGAWAASFGNGMTLLDPDDGSIIDRYQLRESRIVWWVDVADDGRVLVGGQDSDTLVLGSDMTELGRLPTALAMAWAPDGKHIVGVMLEKGMFIADAETYEILHRRPPWELFTSAGAPRGGGPTEGSFSPDGLMLTFEHGEPATVRAVDVSTGRDVRAFIVGSDEGAAAFSTNGELLAIEADDGLVIRRTDDWRLVRRWALEDDLVDLAWLDNRRLATLTATGAGSSRDINSGRITPLTGLQQGGALRIRDGLVFGFGGRRAILWDPATGARVQEITAGEMSQVEPWQIDVTDTHLLVPSNNTIAAFALDLDATVAEPLSRDNVAFGPYYEILEDGRIASLIAVTPEVTSLELLDPETMTVTHSVDATFANDIAVDAAGRRIAAPAPDSRSDVVLYDSELHEVARWPALDPETDCPEDECYVTGLAFSPGGRLAVGTRGGQLHIYEPDGALVRTIQPSDVHRNSRVRAVFESDSSVIRHVNTDEESLARIDVDDGTIEQLPGHEGRSVFFSVRDPLSGTIALADDQGRVTIRLPGEREPSKVLETGAGIRDIRWSGPGRLLVTSTDETVLWDLDADRPITTFGGNFSDLRGGLWLGDGRIATLGRGGDVRVHKCLVCGPIEEVVAEARASLTRELTAVERELYLGS